MTQRVGIVLLGTVVLLAITACEPVAKTDGGATASTDASGRFKIDGVGTGSYKLTARKTKDDRYGLLEGVRGGATNVSVALEVGQSIEGTLDDASGQATQNGSVIAINDTWRGWAPVESDGHWRIWGLPPGAYKISGSVRSARGVSEVVENVSPGTTNVRLRLPGS